MSLTTPKGSAAVPVGDVFMVHQEEFRLIDVDSALTLTMSSKARNRWHLRVDLGGRPWAEVSLDLRREAIGGLACENATHFVISFAQASRSAIHLDVLRGANDHHKVEGAFKALARALRAAVRTTGGAEVPSTKGVL